jgi:hypothetical protein
VNDAQRLYPELGGVIGGALRDTWPALKSWLGWLIAMLLVAGAGLVSIFSSGFMEAVKTNPPGDIAHPALYGVGLCAVVLSIIVGAIFCLTSAIRTVRPEFRMTVGTFFGFLGYSLLVGLIVTVGFVCLVIPGFYLAIKLSPVPYLYLFGEREPMKRSWAIMKGRFWWTVLMLFVVGLCAQVGAYAIGIVGAVGFFIPFALFVLAPAIVAGLFAIYQFQYNAYVRWYDELLKTA